MWDDELAQDEDSDSPLALKHFVVYRLCPTDSCESNCDDAVYGTYTLEVGDYLDITIENQRQDFENMCQNCDEECNEDGQYCSGCGKICYQYENLEARGYIDASDYVECQQLNIENGNDGNQNEDEKEEEQDGGQEEQDDGQGRRLDENLQLYIGPRCSSSGKSIKIGVFADENCWEPVDDADVEELLGAKLSYHLLAHTYSSDDSVCLSCKEQREEENDGNDDDGGNNEANERDQYDADDVNEMCENLYNSAAKCESETGLNGFVQVNREEEDYENQVENEFMACTFINSLLWNSYSEKGEIIFQEPQDVIIRELTKKQAVSLGILALAMLSLFGLMYYFQRKISSISSHPIFSKKGETSSFI
jgi:hypothetical protein